MMAELDQGMYQLSERLEQDERVGILRWISNIPYETDHYVAGKGRVDGTGEWLIQHEIYKGWRQAESSRFLWLHGTREFT